MNARLVMIAGLLLLGSCNKPVKCDFRGMIVTPADASARQAAEDASRNIDLMNRQLETRLGRATGYTREALEKAEGCP